MLILILSQQNADWDSKVSLVVFLLPPLLKLSVPDYSMTCAYHRINSSRIPFLIFFFSFSKGGGAQGFQKAPIPDSFILNGVGAAGTVQSERGLTFYELPLTGHM